MKPIKKHVKGIRKTSRFKRKFNLSIHKLKMFTKTLLLRSKSKFTPRFIKKLRDIPDNILLEFACQFPTREYKGPSLWTNVWLQIDWPSIENQVYILQENVYQRSMLGLNVYTEQESLINNPACSLLAVRRVAQNNQGKNTAGVDGVKSLSHRNMLALSYVLKLDGQSRNVKRVYIPKPGSDKKRPLGIPTLMDRAKQALAKIAIEPEWEAKFEETSYGFRPGRSAHDCTWRLWNSLHRANKWVLDGDIEKCFDRISHQYILNKLNFPSGSILEWQVRAWLQAGIVEPGCKGANPNYMGTPQGGVISPLLSNIALHGMITECREHVSTTCGKDAAKYLKIVRYADDFVVLGRSEKDIMEAQKAIENFLSKVGLNISKAKTRILYTGHSDKDGNKDNTFIFLGLSYKHLKVTSRHKEVKINAYSHFSYTLSILPSQKALKSHFAQVKFIIKNSRTPEILIKRLNPVIRGWVNYFCISTARTNKQVGKYNTRLWKLISAWQKRTYGSKKKDLKLWGNRVGDKWCLYYYPKGSIKKVFLHKYSEAHYSVRDYIPVQGTKSPFDGNIKYWTKRLPSYARAGDLHVKLLSRQGFKCALCHKPFRYSDEKIYEIDHVIRIADGGTNQLRNLQCVHPICHQIKTAKENSVV
jgi:RNA-directed DNA polymerase